jgi:phage terminase large subunit
VEITLPNNWEPRPYQLPAWRYLQRGGRHAELIWHRRAGKDEIGMHWAACAAHLRRGNYWHMLPEYAQARKAIWDAINPHTGKRRIDEAFPPELRSYTRNDEMQIGLKVGSSWQVVGSDRYDSLVGTTPVGIVYSEWALANPNVRAYLRPIIAENLGWQLFITTPRGRNHAYTTLKAAEKMMAGGDAFAQVLDATETGVFTPAQLAAELAEYIATYGEDYGRAKFEQEYLCSFEAANLGAILARALGIAEKQGRISDEIDFDPYGAPIEISADIGRRDTATWWFWQPTMGGYHLIDHDSGWGIDAEEWCYRLRDRISKYKAEGRKTALGRIWLPHDAKAKTFAAKRSAVEIFPSTSARPRGHDAAGEHCRPGERRPGDGARCAFNATKCEKGLNALRAWSYKYDDEKKTFSSEPEHDWASHDGDGFSYGCVSCSSWSRRPSRRRPCEGHRGGSSECEPGRALGDAPKRTDRI